MHCKGFQTVHASSPPGFQVMTHSTESSCDPITLVTFTASHLHCLPICQHLNTIRTLPSLTTHFSSLPNNTKSSHDPITLPINSDHCFVTASPPEPQPSPDHSLVQSSPMCQHNAGVEDLCRHPTRPLIMYHQPDMVPPTPPIPIRPLRLQLPLKL
jgi:hypothetical protein